MRRLSTFGGVHKGKRCFVLGNGPSLKQTDLSRLNGEFTICTNRIYLMLDQLGFTPSYYVVAKPSTDYTAAGSYTLSVQ